jgi:Fe-S cluster assembly protein SufD
MNDTQTKTLQAVDDLNAFASLLEGPEWLVSLRKAAAERFAAMEWPTTSEEEWRRTNLSPFDFGVYETRPAAVGSATAVPTRIGTPNDAGVHGGTHADRAGVLAFRDDVLTTAWIDPAVEASGVVFGDLLSVVGRDEALDSVIHSTLDRTLSEADNRFVVWNLALMQNAAVLFVPSSTDVEAPFEIDLSYSGDEVVAAPHLIVIVERAANVSVVRRIRGEEEGEVLVVDGGAFVLGDGAGLRYANLQRMNDESVYFGNDRGNAGRDARLHRTEVALGAGFVKTRYVSELTGPGADAVLNGIYFGVDEDHMDLRTVQRHRARNTTSRAFYRGAVRDESHAIYQGLIRVDHEAVGTDAYLTNKNLILGEEARADSIPSLAISTDDVRCSHGSTTGRLDPDQLYYLRSRGFTEIEAKRLLVEGYYEDLIVQTPDFLQDEIRQLIFARIGDDE